MKIFSIEKILKDRKNQENQRKLDLEASYVLLKECLFYLNMNSLEELVELKKLMKKTMKKLQEKGEKDVR